MNHYHPPIMAIVSGLLGLFAMATDVSLVVGQAAPPAMPHDWLRDAVNLGGMGLFALSMLLLHREAIKSFGDRLSEMMATFTGQLAAEREENRKLWDSFLTIENHHHAEIMAELRQKREASK